MQDQHQHVRPLAQPEQVGAERRLGRQVEAAAHDRPHGLGRVVGLPDRQGDRLRIQDVLPGHAVVLREDGAQDLVPGRDVAERGAQRVAVHRPVQADRERDVVGRVRPLDLVEEPEPGLGGRERDPLGPGTAPQRRPGGAPGGHAGDEAGGRRLLEDRRDRHADAEGLPDPHGQPGGQQRVPAQVEEPVVRPDAGPSAVRPGAGQPEDLGEEGAHRALLGALRLPARPGGGPEVGQRGPVQLPVGRTGQRVQPGDGRGHHPGGQARGGELPELAGVRHERRPGGVRGDGCAGG
ncbi:hypothetical protein Pve01_55760 [Planomonospora venezuelensis]|nr:hypothetical protein Pve01_55760 [Planomonospora venezuelensis]